MEALRQHWGRRVAGLQAAEGRSTTPRMSGMRSGRAPPQTATPAGPLLLAAGPGCGPVERAFGPGSRSAAMTSLGPYAMFVAALGGGVVHEHGPLTQASLLEHVACEALDPDAVAPLLQRILAFAGWRR